MSRWLLPLSIAVALGCGSGEAEQVAQAQQGATGAGVAIRQVESEGRVESASAPGGSWIISVRYPQIDSGLTPEIRGEINSSIEARVERYRCEGEGDQQFAAEVTRNDGQLLSMRFEVMWMCGSMPAPDSKIGGLTYDLRTGRQIELLDELAAGSSLDELDRRIAEETRAAISEKLGGDASNCPDPDTTREFFLTDRAIVFVGMFPAHVDAACEVDVAMPLETLRSYLRGGTVLVPSRS